MLVSEAECAIRNLVLRPGYTVTPVQSRFEGTVRLDWTYKTKNSDRENAPLYRESITVRVTNHVRVDDIDDSNRSDARVELARRILHLLLTEIENHEWREFLRFEDDDYWAPLHPHRTDGIHNHGTPELDLRYGVA